MKLRKLLIRSRELWLLPIAASLIVASPFTARAFSDADLTGGLGCLGSSHSTLGDITELMQLNFNGAAGVTGSVHLLISGGDCLASVGPGSGYSVNTDGTGSLTLDLSFSGFDSENHFNCTKLNSSKFSVQKVDLILERAGKVFDFAAQDDFFSAQSDRGDIASPFTGSCTGQGQF